MEALAFFKSLSEEIEASVKDAPQEPSKEGQIWRVDFIAGNERQQKGAVAEFARVLSLHSHHAASTPSSLFEIPGVYHVNYFSHQFPHYSYSLWLSWDCDKLATRCTMAFMIGGPHAN